MQSKNENVKISVSKDLLEQTKAKFPEVKGLTYTGVNDWALRYLLGLKDVYMPSEALCQDPKT